MCGIAGIINFDKKPVKKEQLQVMLRSIKHRGPDDEGIFINNNIGLGHVRLSIIDLSPAGHQPMFSNDGRYCILHNGEVYNYIELREELSSKYKFKTKTDTEVILAAYREWGEDCLNKFNGMFAFVIYDTKTKELFIARDRFGIKPLYYYKDNKRFIFASEIAPILTQLLGEKIKPYNQVIFEYLAFNRTDQTENTFFVGINKVQHGNLVNISGNNIDIKKWYCLRDNIAEPFNSPVEYRELLSSAVGLRLRSDVPVGVCLSGGLDSSSIVSLILKDHNKPDIKTFSALFGKKVRTDERQYIKEYDNDLSNMYFIVPTYETLLADIDSFVSAHGEPIPSLGPYAHFKVMDLAKDKAVVLLDGQGADEELGGYHYFFGFYLKELFYRLKFITFLKELYYDLKSSESLYPLKSFLFLLLPPILKTGLKTRLVSHLSKDFTGCYAINDTVIRDLYESKSLKEAILNHFEYKLEHLLKWEDRNSMWFSLESRLPFLDHRLVEKTLALQNMDIINRGMTKYILREAMRNILPEKIRSRRDKIGFGAPHDDWFRSKRFQDFFFDIVNSEKFRSRSYFNHESVIKLYQNHLNRQINAGDNIWKCVNLEIWFNKFIDYRQKLSE